MSQASSEEHDHSGDGHPDELGDNRPCRDEAISALNWLGEERQKLLRYIRPHCGDLDPEDVLADVTVRLIERIRVGGPTPEHITAYLVQAAKNHVIDYYRSPKSRVVIFDPLDSDHLTYCDDPHWHAVETADDRALVRQAFGNLTPAQQEVLLETVIHGRRPRDLTARFGLTAPRIATAAYRARKALGTEILRVLLSRGSAHCQQHAPMVAKQFPRLPPAAAAHLSACLVCQQHLEYFRGLAITGPE